MVIQTPHDHLFSRGFDDPEVGRAELRRILPKEVIELLDLDSLRVEPTRTIDGDLELREGDVLYRVNVRSEDRTSNARVELFVWFMFEHQSRDQELMVLRLLEYMVRQWTEHVASTQPTPKKLPLIIPVVVAHAERRWRSPQRLRELYDAPDALLSALAPLLLDFGFVLDDLVTTTDEEIDRTSTSTYLTLLLWSLKSRGHVPRERIGPWREHLRRLYAERGAAPIEGILSYHLAVASDDVPTAVQAAIEAHSDLERTYMTLAEKIEQRGIERGIEKGKELGFALGERRGKAEALGKLVALKFGVQSAELDTRIAELDLTALDRALEHILTASTIDDLFDPR